MQVSGAQVLDSISLQPLPEYSQLPSVPTWQSCPGNSSLKIWLPAAQGSSTGKTCRGLDVAVAAQQGEAIVMG